MRSEAFDFLSNLDTIWAIVLGAVLATAGGLAAFFVEDRIEYRRRERSAALFFGESFTALHAILEFAAETRRIGEPYGPITMRILRSARREIEIYERNRENLFYIRDAKLRTRIHTCITRIALPLDGILDATLEIDNTDIQSRALPISDAAARAELDNRITGLKERRDSGFAFMMDTAEQLKALITALEPLARQSFSELMQIARQ